MTDGGLFPFLEGDLSEFQSEPSLIMDRRRALCCFRPSTASPNVPAIDHAAMDAANPAKHTEQTDHSIVYPEDILAYLNYPASKE